MGGIEKFIARSVKDVGADEIVAALLSNVKAPTRQVRARTRNQRDIEQMQAVIRAAAEAAKSTDGDVELNIEFE